MSTVAQSGSLGGLRRAQAWWAEQVMPQLLPALFVMLAAAGGLVVASGNLVLTGLAVGAILGLLMLHAPSAAVWVVLVGTLAISGPLLMHQPQLVRLSWLLSMLGFFLLAAAVVHEGAQRDPHRRPVPAFIILGACYLLYAVCSIAVGGGPLEEGVSAFKRQFQYWGLMFALAAVAFPIARLRGWWAFLLVLAVLQLPLALYQRIVLVPRRLNMPNQVVPVDIVTGTLEGSMTGGASNNVMVLLLVAAVCALLAAHRESILPRRWLWPLLALVAAPLALGETKMALILLPMGLWVVNADLVGRRPLLFAGGALLTAVVVGGLFYTYVALQAEEGRTGMSFRQRLEENIDYNVGRRGYYGGASLNRGNVLPFWWERHGLRDPVGTVFGHGLGAAHGARGSERLGHMDRRYPGHSIGLTAVAAQLWELGLLGTGLFAGMMLAAWRAASQLVKTAAPGEDRAMCRTLRATTAMLIPMWLLMDLMLMVASLQVLMAFTLGALAWRWRWQARSDQPSALA